MTTDQFEWLIINAVDIYGVKQGICPVRVHSRQICKDRGIPCCVHNPSSHKMISWPQQWRSDKQLMERLCKHGKGHPDPDHIAWEQSKTTKKLKFAHSCDGCCG